jgi:hypothetical protein
VTDESERGWVWSLTVTPRVTNRVMDMALIQVDQISNNASNSKAKHGDKTQVYTGK